MLERYTVIMIFDKWSAKSHPALAKENKNAKTFPQRLHKGCERDEQAMGEVNQLLVNSLRKKDPLNLSALASTTFYG